MKNKSSDKGMFFLVYGDTGKQLGLRGNEILVYSVIDHYTKNFGACKGGLTFISNILNCRVATAQSVINSLLDKGVIEKIPTNNKVKYYYRTTKKSTMQNGDDKQEITSTTITETVKEEDKDTITENDNDHYGNRKDTVTETVKQFYGNRKDTITETVNSITTGIIKDNTVGNTKEENIHSELYLDSEEKSQKDLSENPQLVYDKENECYTYVSRNDLSWLGE